MTANQPDIQEVLDQLVQLQQEMATLQQVNSNLQTTVNTLLNAAPAAPAQQETAGTGVGVGLGCVCVGRWVCYKERDRTAGVRSEH